MQNMIAVIQNKNSYHLRTPYCWSGKLTLAAFQRCFLTPSAAVSYDQTETED